MHHSPLYTYIIINHKNTNSPSHLYYSSSTSLPFSFSLFIIIIKRNYLVALDKAIKEEEKNLFIKNKELEIRRDDLIKKQVERKTVDILKERKKEEFIKEEERKISGTKTNSKQQNFKMKVFSSFCLFVLSF